MYHKNLIEYIPQIFQDIREYKAIFEDGEQEEFNVLWQGIENALNNQFVEYANEAGVKRSEKILNISPKSTATLDERKFTIKSRLNEEIPFTFKMLDKKLKMLCGDDGYILVSIPEEYRLVVGLGLVAYNNYYDVENLLKKMVPANIIIEISEIYNRHSGLHGFTYEELEEYTHYQLRNEVF